MWTVDGGPWPAVRTVALARAYAKPIALWHFATRERAQPRPRRRGPPNHAIAGVLDGLIDLVTRQDEAFGVLASRVMTPTMSTSSREVGLATGAVALFTTSLAALPREELRAALGDIKSPLPLVTRLALAPELPFVVAAVVMVILVAAVLGSHRAQRTQWTLFAIAGGAVVAAWAFFFVATYLPIFTVAESIKV